jgi:hypothetical protein
VGQGKGDQLTDAINAGVIIHQRTIVLLGSPREGEHVLRQGVA